jgi:hypothetical protein
MTTVVPLTLSATDVESTNLSVLVGNAVVNVCISTQTTTD